ncbi:hypothetical protein ACFXG4_50035 [Nocardia sp. NPDC059246]|uniref:hypothetical protein n=1 Tax=unclassified Nocardia TaxID=2637762 RepID=UPI003684C955
MTARDLDPDKIGGWSSYSYQVDLCQPHATALVLMGDQIKDLGKFTVQSVGSLTSGSVSWRSSGALPAGMKIPLEVLQIGSRTPSTIDLYIDAAQSRKLIEVLELHAEL